MLLTNKSNLPELAPIGKKFIRRKDLTAKIRANIAIRAYMAQQNSKWGEITSLSKEFNVSRPFIYDALSSLDAAIPVIFGQVSPKNNADKTEALHHILSLRMEGKCSIEGISSIMKRFGLQNNSIGFISQYLTHVGSLLPETATNNENITLLVVFASDEIFSKSTPVLVTVDPVSSAILKIELSNTRKAKEWINHWNCIEDNGYSAIYLVSDEGKGLTSGHSKGLSEISRQPDTFHVIAHKLGFWVNRFEKAAYQAIEKEYKSLKKIKSTKNKEEIAKNKEAYDAAVEVSRQKIELYEEFKYVYTGLVRELLVFDSNGNLRKRGNAEENINIYLVLIDTLNNKKLSGEVKRIRKILPDLLMYFDRASEILKGLKDLLPNEDALKCLCAAWQCRKKYIKSKKAEIRNYFKKKESFCLEIAEGYLQETYEDTKEQVYNELNNIVQSSAMVECVNSIIRPYLNTSHNLVSQEMLNLIMFYHNHRRYKSGERAGKTPSEILTGTKQDKDWLELLFDVIGEKNVPKYNKQSSLSSGGLCMDDICRSSSDDYFATSVKALQ